VYSYFFSFSFFLVVMSVSYFQIILFHIFKMVNQLTVFGVCVLETSILLV